jgi:hypothetical protein
MRATPAGGCGPRVPRRSGVVLSNATRCPRRARGPVGARHHARSGGPGRPPNSALPHRALQDAHPQLEGPGLPLAGQGQVPRVLGLCLRTAAHVPLGRRPGPVRSPAGSNHMRLHGTYVAYSGQVGGEYDTLPGTIVAAVDLRSGSRHEHEAGPPCADNEYAFTLPEAQVARLVVTTGGALAWTARAPGYGRCSGWALLTPKRRGTPRARSLLAEGRDLDPRSLRLRAARISWLQAGKRMSAPLR